MIIWNVKWNSSLTMFPAGIHSSNLGQSSKHESKSSHEKVRVETKKLQISLSLSLSSLSLSPSLSLSLSLSHIVVQSKQVGKNQAKTLGLDQTMSPTPSPLGFFPTLMTSALPIINAAIWSAKRINTIVRVLHFIATFLWWSRLSIFSW